MCNEYYLAIKCSWMFWRLKSSIWWRRLWEFFEHKLPPSTVNSSLRSTIKQALCGKFRTLFLRNVQLECCCCFCCCCSCVRFDARRHINLATHYWHTSIRNVQENHIHTNIHTKKRTHQPMIETHWKFAPLGGWVVRLNDVMLTLVVRSVGRLLCGFFGFVRE